MSIHESRGVRSSRSEDYRDLRDLSPTGQLLNITRLASTYAVALGAIAMFWRWPNVATFLFAFAVVSSQQQLLLNIEHDAIHRLFLRPRWLNDLVGTVFAAAPAGSGFYGARATHIAHHRLLDDPSDPDRNLHSGDILTSRAALRRYLTSSFAGGYPIRLMLRREVENPRPFRDLGSLAVVHSGLFGGIWYLTDWWVYPVLWALPVITLTSGCHAIRSLVDHAMSADELANRAGRLVTTRSHLVERALVAPFWLTHHAEHHLFPWIPARNLPEVRRRLTSDANAPAILWRSSYFGAVRSLYDALPA